MPPKQPKPNKVVGKGMNAALQLVLPLFGQPRERDIPRPAPPLSDKPGKDKKHLGPGESARTTQIGSRQLDYVFRRRPRKSIGFTIDRRGLVVSAPGFVTLKSIERAIQEKGPWITTKLEEWQAFEARLAHLRTDWTDGGRLRYLGHNLIIQLNEASDGPHLDMTTMPWQLHLPLARDASPEEVRRLVDQWLKRRARQLFASRLTFFAKRLGQGPSSWRLSSAKTLWGTCTQDGLIRLNWRLIHLSTDLIDYVVAHELAHLKELNHSPAFWKTVRQILPDYERAKKRLSEMPEHLAL